MNITFFPMDKKGKFERTVEIIIHICIWTYIFASPLLMRRWGEEVDWVTYFQRLYFPLSSCMIFYINYFYLVPRFILKDRRTKAFIVTNIVLILAFMASRDLYVTLLPPIEMRHHPHRDRPMHEWTPMFFETIFFLRNFISMAFLVFLAAVVRLSVQWRKAEVARQEAELGRSEAELKNLKNQINPHFLLNTLNNIYALTAFDADKAQQAISELSHLLRYVLYENQAQFVSLSKEVEFLKTYIALMRIRLSANVWLDIELDLPPGDRHAVAPLVFISLVENAFKHGVSPTQPSFIAIRLTAEERRIVFTCSNSYFPKSESDKSPGGIGLKQVRSRLEHAYSDHYEWHYGTDADAATYVSEIIIHLGAAPAEGAAKPD